MSTWRRPKPASKQANNPTQELNPKVNFSEVPEPTDYNTTTQCQSSKHKPLSHKESVKSTKHAMLTNSTKHCNSITTWSMFLECALLCFE